MLVVTPFMASAYACDVAHTLGVKQQQGEAMCGLGWWGAGLRLAKKLPVKPTATKADTTHDTTNERTTDTVKNGHGVANII